ncbi:ATP-binding cassette domain-containing protein [Cryptosporangium phraense]|uniref:ATP-binding cassette domain-containing protein n=1 Tax=Cryptosporangium phraense TaxID=2593070 RepID=A0A545AWH3_9ACTN|nr:ATP-binding cassette domain-containing protein [Cryptosporangium phraense]TQS45677.1 ATP-binding cassette domain-containing protein [Cryptosporangium phraense]
MLDVADAPLLRLENVTVSALRDVSLVARPGRVTALTGPGTETALAVALGLVRPARGRVTLGGIPLEDLDPSARWTTVCWVPQLPVLLAATIAENIRLGWSASDAEVAAAAAAAGGLPPGLDTVVGEDGAGLTAGERQRIGLARAFLRDPAVVVLDEPADDDRFLDALRRLVPGRTVLMVAHRPSLLALADEVVAL